MQGKCTVSKVCRENVQKLKYAGKMYSILSMQGKCTVSKVCRENVQNIKYAGKMYRI